MVIYLIVINFIILVDNNLSLVSEFSISQGDAVLNITL